MPDKIILSFDLDFTLIDNREGIINSFHYALDKHHLPDMSRKDIEKQIGVPLDEIFSQISNLNPTILTSAFREYYREKGIYQVKLIGGAKEILEELRESQFKTGVITSKKEEMAVKLLEYLKINHYFEYIFGETVDIKSKSDPKLKDRLLKKYPNYRFVIIGDHPSDRKLAEMLGCPFIGVLTGIHTAEDLEQDCKTSILILNNVSEITVERIYSLF
jgi:phosphoglycolate phosphatase